MHKYAPSIVATFISSRNYLWALHVCHTWEPHCVKASVIWSNGFASVVCLFSFSFPPLGRYLSTGDLTKVYIDCTMFIGTISSAEPVGCFRPRGDRQGYAALQYCWRQIAGRCQSYGKSDTSSGPALPESLRLPRTHHASIHIMLMLYMTVDPRKSRQHRTRTIYTLARRVARQARTPRHGCVLRHVALVRDAR